MKKIIVGLIVCFALLQTALYALEVKPGGILYAHYEYVTSNHLQNGTTTQDYGAFEVSRIYLNADAKYDEKISAFVQLEANLTSRDNKNNRVYVKNAELRYNFNDYAKLCGGLINTPWVAYELAIWKHRFVITDMENLEGLFPTSDRGIKLFGKWNFFEYDAMLGNGEGTGADGTSGNEVTSFNGGGRLKDYTLKLSLTPLKSINPALEGFKINLLGHKGNRTESQLRNRIYGGLSYESKTVNFMGTYYNADNSAAAAPSRGEGFSVHTVVQPLEKIWFIARFDRYDPDIHVGGDAKNRYIYGVGYQLIKGVRLTIDHQYLQQERKISTRQDESIVFVHTEAKF